MKSETPVSGYSPVVSSEIGAATSKSLDLPALQEKQVKGSLKGMQVPCTFPAASTRAFDADSRYPNEVPWSHASELSVQNSRHHGGVHLPQTVAHRGYKAKYPENSMSAFINAVRVGARGLETDIHLSKDGVVVLSHDPSLKRCFGINKQVCDCDWKYLSTLQTLQAPHEPLARLVDLLQYLASPQKADIWLILDIKIDNPSVKVMHAIADAIRSVPSTHRAWSERIVLGCWKAEFLPLCYTFLPHFPIALITFSIAYAYLFLRIPNISFNVNHKVLMGPGGKRFLAAAKRAQRPVFVWTVNDENCMRWAIKHEVDAVLTDDPVLFRKVCDEWKGLETLPPARKTREINIPLKQQINILMVATTAFVISSVLMLIYRGRVRKLVSDRAYHPPHDA